MLKRLDDSLFTINRAETIRKFDKQFLSFDRKLLRGLAKEIIFKAIGAY